MVSPQAPQSSPPKQRGLKFPRRRQQPRSSTYAPTKRSVEIVPWSQNLRRQWDRVLRSADNYRRNWVQQANQNQALRPVVRAFACITAAGWFGIITATVSLFLAFRFGWLEVALLGLALTVSLIFGVVWILGYTHYQVELKLAGQQVTVGERALGSLRVKNPSNRTSAASEMQLPVGEAAAVIPIPKLAPLEDVEETFLIPTRRRGVITLGPVTSVRRDGIGFFRRKRRWNEPQDLYIYPRTVSLDAQAIGFIRDIEGTTTQELSSSDVAFHALRDYIPGDDIRNIHWKTTARVGKLMVRQFEETRRAHLLLILDLRAESWQSPEDAEIGISVAASIAKAALMDGRQVSLHTQVGEVEQPTTRRIMDFLTEIEISPDVTALPTLTANAVTAVPNASVVLTISGMNVGVNDFYHAYTKIPVNMVSASLRIAQGLSLSRGQIGDLPLLTLGKLEQLPRGLRRVSL